MHHIWFHFSIWTKGRNHIKPGLIPNEKAKIYSCIGPPGLLMMSELKWALFQKSVLYFVSLFMDFPFLFTVRKNNIHLTYNRTPWANDLPGRCPWLSSWLTHWQALTSLSHSLSSWPTKKTIPIRSHPSSKTSTSWRIKAKLFSKAPRPGLLSE